jgi:hypothetical protein
MHHERLFVFLVLQACSSYIIWALFLMLSHTSLIENFNILLIVDRGVAKNRKQQIFGNL